MTGVDLFPADTFTVQYIVDCKKAVFDPEMTVITKTEKWKDLIPFAFIPDPPTNVETFMGDPLYCG